jgi:GntR family transcriptional regulator
MREINQEPAGQKPPFLKELGINFALDTKSGVPFYRQIIQVVEYNMSIGKLKPGDKLPTIRALSIGLKVNPNTIAKAYMELEIRGLVQTQVGSGTYISDTKVEMLNELEHIRKKLEELCWDFLRQAKALGVDKEEIIDMLKSLKDNG